jgi:hypothetical protein
VTQPGEECPVCGYPDPEHDWDTHEARNVRYRSADLEDDGRRGATTMHSSSRGGARVLWLAVHTTEGIMRARDLRAWTSWPGSSHAANDETGVLLSGDGDGFVSYDRAAWTLRNGNPVSDNLEQCGWARWTRAEWLARPELLDTTARWLAERHRARPHIPLRRLSYAEIRARQPGVIMHADYTYATGDGTHTDCGKNYPWDVVLAAANRYAGNNIDTEPEDPDVAFTEKHAQLLEDLHYGLRRPVVNGVTLSTAVRDVQNRVVKLDAQHPDTGPTTATAAGEDEPVAPWTDEQVDQLAEQLEAELSPEQVQNLVSRIQS